MKKLLLLALWGLIFFSFAQSYTQAYSESCPQEQEKHEASKINKLSAELLRYNERLLEIFQSVGHYINKGNSNLSIEQKKLANIWVQENQKNINIINQKIIDCESENLLSQYAAKTNSMVLSLNLAILSNFKNLIKTDITVKRSILLEPIETEEVLNSTQSNINNASIKVEKLGFTKLNLFIRELEKIDLNWGVTPKVKSILLYSLITTVGIRILDKSYFPESFGIKSSKNFVDRRFFPSKSSGLNNNNNNNNNTGTAATGSSNSTHTQDSSDKESFIKSLFTGVASAVIVDAFKGDLGDFIKKTYQNLIRDFNAGIKNTYSLLRGTPSKISTSGYEFVSSSNTLEDRKLVGLENQKKTLGQLVSALKNLQIFEKAKIGINKAYLITGPAGCGKSYLARAICGSINKNLEERGISNRIGFKEVKFTDMWTSNGIEGLIKDAQANAPCILFIDEIHLLKLQTEGDGKSLTEFLTALSGINSENIGSKPVIIIAATNRPDLLDPALLRSGRFEVVKVEKPNFQTRKDYFQIMLKDQGINTDNFDIERLAHLTENCSYAQLDQIIRDSRFRAKSQARGISSTKDIEDSIDTIVFKIKNEKILPITENSKKIIASQIAGKTLLQILFDEAINKKILKVTLKATVPAVKESMMYSPQDKIKAVKEKKTKYGHIFTYSKDEIANLEDAKSLELQCKVLLSGQLAEQIIFGTTHVLKKSDKTNAFELTKKIVYKGLKPEVLSKNMQKEYENKALMLFEKFESETKIILEENKSKLQKIYQDLFEKETLSRHELFS